MQDLTAPKRSKEALVSTGYEMSGDKVKMTPLEMRNQREKDRELVRGIFKFYEVPGGSMEFCVKFYKEDPVERFLMFDEGVYTIPLGVAKHLNKNGWYPVHTYQQDERGRASQIIGQKIRRFGFQSLEFVDLADLTPEGKPANANEGQPERN